jgi:hypothetical protein
MPYFVDLFTPETWEAFRRHGGTVSGFRRTHESATARIRAGDKLVCYLTRFSRWVGILEIEKGPFIDDTPIFQPSEDPFVVRFAVKPIVLLEPQFGVPVYEDRVWDRLSFTQGRDRGGSAWRGMIRGSLSELEDADGAFLESLVREQAQTKKQYPINNTQLRRLAVHRISREDRDIAVSVPPKADEGQEVAPPQEIRESVRIQALLAEIGVKMGMTVWVPRNDRAAVTTEMVSGRDELLDRLPLNYNEATLRTIEQIDVIWIKRRSIRRAFEVEHTTSIYSGILRMADLLALQPNMDISAHIVAPSARREKVFQEISRPVFSFLDRAPLSETCTFLSYDSVRALAQEKHLQHLSEAVLEQFVERADGVDDE